MNRSLLGTIVGLVVAILLFSSSYYIVHPSEWALVLQLGAPVRVVPDPQQPEPLSPNVGPGLYFKLPLVQNVVILDKRVLNFDAPPEEVPTLDQNQVIVSAYARFQIINPLLFYQTVNNEDGVAARLRPVISSNLRRALGNVPMAAILTSHRAELMQQITQQVDRESQQFGIKVIDVRMKRVDLTQANSEAIFEQMRTQRQQVAIDTRAQGQAQATERRAEGDKQQVIILADARKQSEILRGEGDATATAIYAAAFGKDPAFFDFYRSLQAMGTALDDSSTTYVGTPDTDFFRYFHDESGAPPGGKPPAGGTGAASPQ